MSTRCVFGGPSWVMKFELPNFELPNFATSLLIIIIIIIIIYRLPTVLSKLGHTLFFRSRRKAKVTASDREFALVFSVSSPFRAGSRERGLLESSCSDQVTGRQYLRHAATPHKSSFSPPRPSPPVGPSVQHFPSSYHALRQHHPTEVQAGTSQSRRRTAPA